MEKRLLWCRLIFWLFRVFKMEVGGPAGRGQWELLCCWLQERLPQPLAKLPLVLIQLQGCACSIPHYALPGALALPASLLRLG